MNGKTQQLTSIINVFFPPYERWSTRERTLEEQIEYLSLHGHIGGPIKLKLLKKINSTYQAAEHMAEHLVDNCLENFIDNALSNSPGMKDLHNLMPDLTPDALSAYKGSYPNYDPNNVALEIEKYGVLLADGQTLIHGGCWPSTSNMFITDRPLSTTFCPQIARRSAEWKGKAYDAGRIEFIVLTVISPSTKAYFYGEDADHAHEKEIVFAQGASLKLISRRYICETTAFKTDSNLREFKKLVPVYVVQAEIS